MITSVPVSAIHPRPDARDLSSNAVAALAESIAAVGLINPIRIRADDAGYEVVAGRHRLEAVKALGLVDIDACIVTDDDLHAELAMIDENLCRAELSPADRATATARRKEIYEALHPETKHGGNLQGAGVAKFATPEGQRFTKATASVVGLSERAVQLAAERGEKVIPEVMAMIRGTHLDSGTYLDKLKKMPPNEQLAAARRDLRQPKEPRAKAPRPMDDAETEEQWLVSIMRVWNRGAKEWRERFMAEIDPPTMDRRFG